jgi:hypothetical protein
MFQVINLMEVPWVGEWLTLKFQEILRNTLVFPKSQVISYFDMGPSSQPATPTPEILQNRPDHVKQHIGRVAIRVMEARKLKLSEASGKVDFLVHH